jgi:hypothetical protein
MVDLMGGEERMASFHKGEDRSGAVPFGEVRTDHLARNIVRWCKAHVQGPLLPDQYVTVTKPGVKVPARCTQVLIHRGYQFRGLGGIDLSSAIVQQALGMVWFVIRKGNQVAAVSYVRRGKFKTQAGSF